MTDGKLVCWGLLILNLIGGTCLQASWFYTFETSSANLGQGLAGLTLVENASVMGGLPAASTFLPEGLHGLVGVSSLKGVIQFDAEHDDFSSKSKNQENVGGYGYAAWHGNIAGQNIAIGVAQFFPYFVSLQWPTGWVGRHVVESFNMTIGTTSPVISWRLADQISIGAGANFTSLAMQMEKQIVLADNIEIQSSLGGSGKATGFNVSLFVRHDHFSYGLNYVSDLKIKSKGNVRFDTKGVPSFTGKFPDGTIAFNVQLPSRYNFGFSFYEKPVLPAYFVEISFTQLNWSDFENLAIQFDHQLPKKEEVYQKSWQDTVQARVGGFYRIFPQIKLRGGINYDNKPLPTSETDPLVSDGAGRWQLGTGIGLEFDYFTWDLSFAHILQNLAENPTDENMPGNYRGTFQVASMSVGGRW